jgi:hypothetical protein
MDDISSIGEIYENEAKGKCGYEACWKGLKSKCPTVNDFIVEFLYRIKSVIGKYQKDGEPIFLKPTEKERRIIPMAHEQIIKDTQIFAKESLVRSCYLLFSCKVLPKNNLHL